MPNLAIALKEEIRRLARKEVKAVVGRTKQTLAVYRREIAALRRELQIQSKKVATLSGARPSAAKAADEEPLQDVRFSARSVRAQRKRLRISAADYGRLIGVSGLTIYNWEHGRTRPRQTELAALIALRHIRRGEAMSRLLSLKSARPAPRKKPD